MTKIFWPSMHFFLFWICYEFKQRVVPPGARNRVNLIMVTLCLGFEVYLFRCGYPDGVPDSHDFYEKVLMVCEKAMLLLFVEFKISKFMDAHSEWEWQRRNNMNGDEDFAYRQRSTRARLMR